MLRSQAGRFCVLTDSSQSAPNEKLMDPQFFFAGPFHSSSHQKGLKWYYCTPLKTNIAHEKWGLSR